MAGTKRILEHLNHRTFCILYTDRKTVGTLRTEPQSCRPDGTGLYFQLLETEVGRPQVQGLPGQVSKIVSK